MNGIRKHSAKFASASRRIKLNKPEDDIDDLKNQILNMEYNLDQRESEEPYEENNVESEVDDL